MTGQRTKLGRTGEASGEPWVMRALRWVVCCSVPVISLAVSVGGANSFRLPKDLLFQAEAVVLVALFLVGMLLGQIRLRRPVWKNPVVLLPTLVIVWALATTLTSTNRPLSWPSFWYVSAASVVFWTTVMVARGRDLRILDWLVWGSLLNAGLYLAQASALWNPFQFVGQGGTPGSGFLGNANDIGSAFLPSVIVTLAAAILGRTRRIFYISCSITLFAAILTASAVVSLGALAVSILVVFGAVRREFATRMAVAVITVVAIFVGLGTRTETARQEIRLLARAAEAAKWDVFTKGRLPAISAAIAMVADRPVVGVGPGTFEWQYFPYKILAVERSDNQSLPGMQGVFDNAHSDHLEILAEVGLPGWILFIVVLTVIAVRRSSSEDDRQTPAVQQRVARATLASLAPGIFVLALGQYPLQLSSFVANFIFVTGVCVAWSWPMPSATQVINRPTAAGFWIAPSFQKPLIILTALGALVVLHFSLTRPWSCNVLTKRMQLAVAAALDDNHHARSYLAQNLDKALSCHECRPSSAALSIAIASTYGVLNRPDDELQFYEDALRYSRRPEIYFNRAVARLRAGDRTGAYDDFVLAARFDPGVIDQINNPETREWVRAGLARFRPAEGSH